MAKTCYSGCAPCQEFVVLRRQRQHLRRTTARSRTYLKDNCWAMLRTSPSNSQARLKRTSQHHEEFVAINPGHCVLLAGLALQMICHFPQQKIAERHLATILARLSEVCET